MNTLMTQSTFLSPMKEAFLLEPGTKKVKKSGVASMMLTSLVDAFTIIVIYLIVNSSANEQLDVKEGIQLPKASHSQVIDQSPTIIYKNNQFFIDDQVVPEKNLRQALESLKNKNLGFFKNDQSAIVVQADESIDFEQLQPLVVASSYAGIKQVKFAVLQQE